MGTTEGLRGAKLLCAAVNKILADPASWNQETWHCGSAHCIAGHVELLEGGITEETSANVQKLLGISWPNALWLFSADRTLAEIYHFADSLRLGYDRDGYDRDGYDRAGYDRAGYDRADRMRPPRIRHRCDNRPPLIPFDLDKE